MVPRVYEIKFIARLKVITLGRAFCLFRPAILEESMQQITGLDFKIKEMAGRIKELREIENLTTEQMA